MVYSYEDSERAYLARTLPEGDVENIDGDGVPQYDMEPEQELSFD